MDPRCASSFICYGATEPSSWLWEKQARKAIQLISWWGQDYSLLGSDQQSRHNRRKQESSIATFAPHIHRTVDQRETWSCSPQWCQRDIECYTRNTLGSKGNRRLKESYQKMHHMQKIWGETIHYSPLPWFAYRSCLWGTAFHVHRDRFCGTTLCQFCVTWESQQSILLPVYMCINTCCPPRGNWEFDSYVFLTSISKIC